jgi:hypothetical protein
MYVNAKMIPAETTPGMGSGGLGLKENGRGGEFMYDIFGTLLRTCANAIVYPHTSK